MKEPVEDGSASRPSMAGAASGSPLVEVMLELTSRLEGLETERLHAVEEQLSEIKRSRSADQHDFGLRFSQLEESLRTLASARADELEEFARHFDREDAASKAQLEAADAGRNELRARLGIVERSLTDLANSQAEELSQLARHLAAGASLPQATPDHRIANGEDFHDRLAKVECTLADGRHVASNRDLHDRITKVESVFANEKIAQRIGSVEQALVELSNDRTEELNQLTQHLVSQQANTQVEVDASRKELSAGLSAAVAVPITELKDRIARVEDALADDSQSASNRDLQERVAQVASTLANYVSSHEAASKKHEQRMIGLEQAMAELVNDRAEELKELTEHFASQQESVRMEAEARDAGQIDFATRLSTVEQLLAEVRQPPESTTAASHAAHSPAHARCPNLPPVKLDALVGANECVQNRLGCGMEFRDMMSSVSDLAGNEAIEDLAMRLDLLERCISAREDADAKFNEQIDGQNRFLKEIEDVVERVSKNTLDFDGRPLVETTAGLSKNFQELAKAHQQIAIDHEALRNQVMQLEHRRPHVDNKQDGRAWLDLEAPVETVRAALADFDDESAQQAEFREELERCAAQAERLRAGVLAAAEERGRLYAGITKFEEAATRAQTEWINMRGDLQGGAEAAAAAFWECAQLGHAAAQRDNFDPMNSLLLT